MACMIVALSLVTMSESALNVTLHPSSVRGDTPANDELRSRSRKMWAVLVGREGWSLIEADPTDVMLSLFATFT